MSEFEKGIEWLLDGCAPWEVVSVTKREQAEGLGRSVVTTELVVRKGQLVPCPKCGRMCKRHDQKWREWRHLDLMQWRTLLRTARTIWKHIDEILNASMLGISNALSESINSKVQ